MKLFPLAAGLLLLLPSLAPAAAPPPVETEICVFGGTAGGVAAACTAARLGKKVVLTEFGAHIGGLTSGGLGWTDIGNKAAIGGFSRRFYQRLGERYHKPEAWFFEPHVAEEELHKLLDEAKVPLFLHQRLFAVTKEGARITEIVMEDGSRYRAKVFIDCSYEGDLMARAGVSYMVGREANARFSEAINGIREKTPSHQFLVPVDPYLQPGVPASGLLPFVQPTPFGEPGAGDASVQAYNFRLCLTKVPENRRPIEPPAGYDPKQYELLGRYCEALTAAGKKVGLRNFLKIDMVTPEKTDINNNGGFSTDYIGFNHSYPDADYATRARIWSDHENYIRGFLVFLATDPRVPAAVREEMAQWGFCKDEFQDTGGFPSALYVREARRMLTDYVMTEKNCRWEEKVEDSVGLGAYNMDSHNCRRLVRDGHVENEGDVQVGVKGPYPVAYRSLVPKAEQCENLLVPICLSATHIAYGSIRMEPVFMILGESAAMAGSLAIDAGATVQKVDYAKLRELLLADQQILAWDGPAHHTAEAQPKLEGILLDNTAAAHTGEWSPGRAGGNRIGEGYVHDGNEGKGEKTLTWKLEVPADGEYEVILYYPPNANRATNVPVTVEAGGAVKSLTVNEKEGETKGSTSLGKYQLTKSQPATVKISNAGTNGFVVVDGLQILPKASPR